jgi:Bacterial PH domain
VIDEFECEPVPGLPANLPAGENLLWQGSPSWTSLARHSLHADKALFYFALLSACRVAWQSANGQTVTQSIVEAAPVFVFGLAGVALLALVSWLAARTTIYSITNRRVVMRYGIALPMTVNIPFKEIGAADLKTYSDQSGDIALAVSGPLKLAYLHLWPHVRPWHLNNAQPAMRSLPDAASVAQMLATHASQFATVKNVEVQTPIRSDVRAQTSDHRTPSFAGAVA